LNTLPWCQFYDNFFVQRNQYIDRLRHLNSRRTFDVIDAELCIVIGNRNRCSIIQAKTQYQHLHLLVANKDTTTVLVTFNHIIIIDINGNGFGLMYQRKGDRSG
jgi:hypothetical protein